MPASFEARLIPHRSTWDVIRLTWAPFVVALLVVIVAELIEPVSAAASDAIGVLASLCFVGGVFYIPFMWQRGPAITVADGALRVGATQAPLAGLAATRGEYVYYAASRVAAGTYWMPMLRLRLADGHELRIACQGAGVRRAAPAPT